MNPGFLTPDEQFRLFCVTLRAGIMTPLSRGDICDFVDQRDGRRHARDTKTLRKRVLEAAVAESEVYHRSTGKVAAPHEVIASAHQMVDEVLGLNGGTDA